MSKLSRHTSSLSTFAPRRHLPVALLSMAFVAAPAMAQRESVTVRTITTSQNEVDRLRRELLAQRRVEMEYGRTLFDLQSRLRAAPADSERIDLQARTQLVFSKLRETSAAQMRIMRQIESICAEVPKPAGWLGVAVTGVSMFIKQGDGQQVQRYLERPVIESVEPGSPADRAGIRAGDVLLDIAGRPLLQSDIVLADLLRPGERVPVRLQRGREVVLVTPLVEAVPQSVSVTPCWADAAVATLISPMPGAQGFRYEVESRPAGADRPRFVMVPGVRADSNRAEAQVSPAGGVFAGPMAYAYSSGSSVLAGVQLIVLNPESSRALGVAHGLFVNQVAQGTPGREAGLQGGDVLVTADSIDLKSVNALQRAIRASHDKSVTIVIVRDRKQETVTLKW